MTQKKSFIEEEYGLTGMPFRTKIATHLELQAWVNREEEMKRWTKVLDDSVRTPNTNFLVFIIGDYGMGKTLSLLKIVEEAKSNRMVYPTYLNLLSEQKPKNPGLDFLQRIFRAINFKVIKARKEDIRYLQKVFPEPAIIFETILFDSDATTKQLCLAFLKGEIKPTQTQLRTMKVLRKIDDAEIAKEYLIGILYLLNASKFSTLVLAIDEFEYLFSLVPKPSQSIYLALFRGLMDLHVQIPEELRGKVANMALFIGLSEDGLRRLDELEKVETSTGGPIKPLMRRVTDRVRLNPLNKKDSQALIEKRLRLNRIKERYEKDPLIPFTQDFVDYIFKLTGGRLADIIVRCDYVLDAGLERKVPRLNAEFAREVFKEKGFVYEV
jgi:hypothetical protein